jgi:hypothetical protein
MRGTTSGGIAAIAAMGLLVAHPAKAQSDGKHTSKTFIYGKYYASDPENPTVKDTTDNS